MKRIVAIRSFFCFNAYDAKRSEGFSIFGPCFRKNLRSLLQFITDYSNVSEPSDSHLETKFYAQPKSYNKTEKSCNKTAPQSAHLCTVDHRKDSRDYNKCLFGFCRCILLLSKHYTHAIKSGRFLKGRFFIFISLRFKV